MSGVALYDYQQDAVDRMRNGCILCGGVGSGKSRTGLAYYYIKNGGKVNTKRYHCIVEAMHVHASDRHLTESGSAKLFVMGNGDTIVKEQGVLTNKELRIIREFIKDNYQEMFLKWSEMKIFGRNAGAP